MTHQPRDLRAINSGQSVADHATRLDGLAKATGAARFGRDQIKKDMLWVRLIRCPWGRAKLDSLDRDAALATPGVVEVVVSGDDGDYHGDSIGYLVARNRRGLERGLRALNAKWTRLDCQTGILDDKQARGPMDAPSEAAAKAIDAADFSFEARYSTPVQTHSSLETHGLMIEPDGESSIVHASTQGTFVVADQIGRFLGKRRSKIVVDCEHVGGGFGSKFQIGKEGAAGGLAAKSSGEAVYSFCDREEEHLDTGNRPSLLCKVNVGHDADGTIRGARFETFGGTGVSRRGGGARVPSGRFEFGTLDARNHRDVQFNAGGPRAMRAPGCPQGAFVEELLIDEIAHRCGLDPLGLRRRLDDSDRRQRMYDVAADLIGWENRADTGSQSGTMRTGYGIGTCDWGKGRAPAKIEVVVHPDGHLEVRTGTQDIGTGQRTAMGALVAARIGVPLANISVAIGDSRLPPGPASGGSVCTPSTAPAAMAAADLARERILAGVAEREKLDATKLTIDDGVIMEGGRKVVRWEDACRRLSEPVSVTGEFDGRASAYWGEGSSEGVQAARVEVDCETGQVFVREVIAIQSCGLPLVRKTAESQIMGGVIQGTSYALFEEQVLDPATGAVLNANLESYKILGSEDCPRIIPVLWRDDQTGVRALGEPPVVPTAAAIANAVFNAIGRPVRDLPLRPDRVLAALAEPMAERVVAVAPRTTEPENRA